MANNLKAERTLTAEELQAIIAESQEQSLFGGNRTTMVISASKVAALASMALQSLSTQQPMGELRDEMVDRALSGLWRGQGLGWSQHQCMRTALTAALLPTHKPLQEEG